ncbi:hypothetical protein [Streptomyces sp. NPDC059272]|uniref:hypothetical protein n=1 Tax=Streptomyces sp. NPDC059272 TaxID=3346800 RepID=UPI00369835C9
MTSRLGIGLPQNRQYDLGRDVPDVANTPRATRRLVDHADGRLSYADGPVQVAESGRQLQDLAAERG